MADKVTYGNTVLKGINKAGNLKPDENGYYTVVLGAIGVMNSGVNVTQILKRLVTRLTVAAAYRGLAKDCFVVVCSPRSCCLSQHDHDVVFIDEEDRICMHIADVWLEEIEHEGKKLTGILGRIRPTGHMVRFLKVLTTLKERYFLWALLQ